MVVRTDKQLGQEFSDSDRWDADASELYNFIEEVEVNGETQRIVSSQSGNERNHLFMNKGEAELQDVSLISGLDSIADGRANAVWDFDRDGRQDIVLVNANDPFLQLFHNQLRASDSGNSNFIAVRLTGGNHSGQASDQWSNRDGIGAVVTVKTGKHSYVREARAGEGFAAQNSKVLLIGIGAEVDAELSVRWPSGKEIAYGTIAAGQIAHCYEDKSSTFDLSGIESKPYTSSNFSATAASLANLGEFTLPPAMDAAPTVQLILYTTMASWCPNCKRNQPLVALLKKQFGDQILLLGVPVDPEETSAQIEEYRKQYNPAYELLDPISSEDIKNLKSLITTLSDQGGLPSTLITDRSGRVIYATGGIPSSSEIAKLLAQPQVASD